jgi:rod shape-determining protein MreD
MTHFLTFLAILIAGVFQTAVVPVNLLLLIVLDWAILRDFKQGVLIGFFSGLVLDFFSLGRLGLSSIIFLGIVFLINLYKRRWDLPNFWLTLVLTFIFSFVFNVFLERFWSFKEGLVLVIVNAVFYPLVSWWQKQEFGDQMKLNL